MVKKHLHYEGHDNACNRNLACVVTCRFFPPTGRIEDEEVFARAEQEKKRRDLKSQLLKRKWEVYRKTGRTWKSCVDEGFVDVI